MLQDNSTLNQTDCEFMNRVGATPHLLKSPLCTDWNPNVGDPNSGGCRFVRGACLCTYTLRFKDKMHASFSQTVFDSDVHRI